MNTINYLKIKEIISDADSILIGAGAGLSSAAGIIYSEEKFKKDFPELVKAYNMTDMYTSSFYRFKTEEERWSYWAKHINFATVSRDGLPLYKDLYNIVKDKPYFVITTNVDMQFLKSGFSKDKVFEVQGRYTKMQCINACHNKLYDSTNLIKEMLKSKNNLRIDSNLVPKCPICGKNMDINIRKDSYFVEDINWNISNLNYEKFIKNNLNKKLVLIELGVGFNTPSIIRFPFEMLASKYKNVTLIRVNDTYLERYYNVEGNFIGVKGNCKNFIENIK